MDYELIAALAAAFAAGFGAGFTFKLVVDRSRRSKVTQTGNRAGGDIAGGDIHKR
jgi:hypothetical protein